MKIKIYNKSRFKNPEYQSAGASGLDLRADIDSELTVESGKITLIPTGIYVEIPEGYEGQVRARSGLAAKHGITLVNGVGTIDSDYRGEIIVITTCLKDIPYRVTPGERIAQLVFTPVLIPELEYVEHEDDLSVTERAASGFGGSGKK